MNISYPYEVTDLRIKEQFNNIIVSWIDPHDYNDPVAFFVQCDSNNKTLITVVRNTTYICEQILFNKTKSISVQTQVVLPNFKYDHIAVSQISTPQIPELPLIEVFNATENSITIRWNFNNNSLISNDFQYKINCGLNESSVEIDIRTNEYQCRSFVPGTVYFISLFLENMNKSIQRVNSIQANTCK